MKRKPAFPTEAALCAKFIAAVEKDGEWTAYAETQGWDILLVRKADGFQIGVQAKLKLNEKVFAQALEWDGYYSADRPGPDCRAVLVPAGETGFASIAAYIGITIVRVFADDVGRWATFDPDLPELKDGYFATRDWHEWCPSRRHDLPEYVPDVPAGASAPVQLTPWKVAALKIAVLIEKRGFVVRADFKHIGIDYRRWTATQGGWLRADGGRYVPGPRFPDFKGQHPRVFEQVAADFEKWAPPEPIVPAVQASMFGAAK